MFRLDDNVYIDESLITCAEYQLFLDEMRALGHYHQPDHWQTHRFSSGQARQPILGVRLLDAQAFCTWLTEHEKGQWNFRLPTPEEVQEFAITKEQFFKYGYWVNDHHEQYLLWTGTYSSNTNRDNTYQITNQSVVWDFDKINSHIKFIIKKIDKVIDRERDTLTTIALIFLNASKSLVYLFIAIPVVILASVIISFIANWIMQTNPPIYEVFIIIISSITIVMWGLFLEKITRGLGNIDNEEGKEDWDEMLPFLSLLYKPIKLITIFITSILKVIKAIITIISAMIRHGQSTLIYISATLLVFSNTLFNSEILGAIEKHQIYVFFAFVLGAILAILTNILSGKVNVYVQIRERARNSVKARFRSLEIMFEQSFTRVGSCLIHHSAISLTNRLINDMSSLGNPNTRGDIIRIKNGLSDIRTNLVTIHNRIEGRSPAFEGIRIVKERIR